jgi:FlaA1/EpsC-like NDP-sugar epimerase
MALLVVIDFVVIPLACWLGNATTFFDHPSVWEYSGSILLTATATVVCFYGCGMYHPPRRVGREQVLAIALTTAISFLIMFMVIAVLQVGGDPGRDVFPGLSLPMAFAYLFVLTVASRLAWVSVIEHMPSHRPRPG